jgi:hypothetical protein
MKLSEHFNRFDILNCNDDSFDDHTIYYGPIGSNHFNHQSAVMVLQTTRPGWWLMQYYGGFLGFFILADCGINFKGFNFYTTRASHRQIKSAQSI